MRRLVCACVVRKSPKNEAHTITDTTLTRYTCSKKCLYDRIGLLSMLFLKLSYSYILNSTDRRQLPIFFSLFHLYKFAFIMNTLCDFGKVPFSISLKHETKQLSILNLILDLFSSYRPAYFKCRHHKSSCILLNTSGHD